MVKPDDKENSLQAAIYSLPPAHGVPSVLGLLWYNKYNYYIFAVFNHWVALTLVVEMVQQVKLVICTFTYQHETVYREWTGFAFFS